MEPSGTQLNVRVAGREESESLRAFLRKRGHEGRCTATDALAIDVRHPKGATANTTGVATLVALVDEWRSKEGAPEVRLELDGQETILRTDT